MNKQLPCVLLLTNTVTHVLLMVS